MTEELVFLQDGWFRYGQGPWILRELQLRVCAGERILLRGPNGCGKSTLLRLLAGMHCPQKGVCHHHHHVCVCCALLPQELRLDLSLPIQARDVVACGWDAGRPWWRPRMRGMGQAVEQALATVGLADQARRSPAQLSGGQRRRLAIARTLVQGARLVLMDEPLSGLDGQSRQQLAEVLVQVTGPGRAALVMASHEISDFSLCFDRDLHFEAGHLIETATANCEMVRVHC